MGHNTEAVWRITVKGLIGLFLKKIYCAGTMGNRLAPVACMKTDIKLCLTQS